METVGIPINLINLLKSYALDWKACEYIIEKTNAQLKITLKWDLQEISSAYNKNHSANIKPSNIFRPNHRNQLDKDMERNINQCEFNRSSFVNCSHANSVDLNQIRGEKIQFDSKKKITAESEKDSLNLCANKCIAIKPEETIYKQVKLMNENDAQSDDESTVSVSSVDSDVYEECSQNKGKHCKIAEGGRLETEQSSVDSTCTRNEDEVKHYLASAKDPNKWKFINLINDAEKIPTKANERPLTQHTLYENQRSVDRAIQINRLLIDEEDGGCEKNMVNAEDTLNSDQSSSRNCLNLALEESIECLQMDKAKSTTSDENKAYSSSKSKLSNLKESTRENQMKENLNPLNLKSNNQQTAEQVTKNFRNFTFDKITQDKLNELYKDNMHNLVVVRATKFRLSPRQLCELLISNDVIDVNHIEDIYYDQMIMTRHSYIIQLKEDAEEVRKQFDQNATKSTRNIMLDDGDEVRMTVPRMNMVDKKWRDCYDFL